MKRWMLFLCAWMALLSPSVFTGGTALAQGEITPVSSPESQPQSQEQTDGTVEGTGLRPDITSTVHAASSAQRRLQASLPAAFNLARQNLVTPVRNQGAYGTCWAFASLASAESLLLGDSLATNPDLSEWQLAYFAYTSQNGLPSFDRWSSGSVFNEGGNAQMAAALLARGSSPLAEAAAPYGGAVPSSTLKPNWDLRQWSVYHTPEEWKTALMQQGALLISFYVDTSLSSNNYKSSTAAYFCKTPTTANHAVTVVGWDDNYPASNFATDPGINGAWIVKNSWGSGWGSNGYFYLSYADATLVREASAFELLPQPQDEMEYTYDELGMIGSFGLWSNGSYHVGWMKATYTAQRNESVTAVGMFLTADNTSYSIQIKTPAGLSAAQNGTVAAAGYLRIPLDNGVNVQAGQVFDVIVKLTNTSTDWPIAVECRVNGYSSQARLGAGQSAFSADGVTWTDGAVKGRDACLSAFTLPGASVTSPAAATGTPAPTISASVTTTPQPTATPTPMPTPTPTPKPTPAPLPVITILPFSTQPIAGAVTVSATVSGGVLDADSHTFTSNGSYDFVARNADGAVACVTVTIAHIDHEAPVIIANRGSQTLIDGGWTNGAVALSASDANLASQAIRRNGVPMLWPGSGVVNADGCYVADAVDALGNRASLRFNIDSAQPVLSAKSSGKPVRAGALLKSTVTLSGSDANLAARVLRCNGVEQPWPANGIIKSDGNYNASLIDRAGNTSSLTFTIDRAAPKFLVSMATGAAMPRNKTSKAAVRVDVFDLTLKSLAAKCNGKTITWPGNGVFTGKGKYTLTAKDRAGYTSSYSFTIR